ncbi:MAG: nickel-dependent lactate racemase [bacterium]
MRIEIPYGHDILETYIDDENFGEIVYPNTVEVKEESKTICQALDNPISSKSFNNFLAGGGNILFIVNDGTRPTPTAKVLDIIHDQIKNLDITFIIATGCHRAPTEEELQEIFGKYLSEYRDRIHSHDANNDEMVYLGKSQNGTEMEVNKLGMDADKIVIIGSVEPHYFAGYTGGRKAFLPGIASYKTIEQNHKLALKMSAQAMKLKDNPVHEDMEDAIKTIKDKEVFTIMTVLDRDDRIYAATAGDITESLLAAIDKSHEVFSVEVKQKADIVVAVAPHPMDIDLYQSQKALDNAKHALNPNGILILVSRCRSGIGHDTFAKLLESALDPQDALEKIEKKYVLGYHKAAKMAEVARWAQMWAVTSIDSDIMKSMFITPFPTIQQALDKAVAEKGKEKILFMMAASMTVPRLRKRFFFRPQRFIHGSRQKDIDHAMFYEDSVELPEDDKVINSLIESR